MGKRRKVESRSGKREVEREEEKTFVVKRRCVTPFCSDVFEALGPMEDSGSFGDSWSDLRDDSCLFHRLRWMCLVRFLLLILIVRL